MRRQQAKAIVASVKKLDLALGELDTVCRKLAGDERRALLSGVFDIIVDAHEKITIPVAKQYPELHPDKQSAHR